ncbi:MAG: hypothetical protein H6702_14895 [Myxococcales bacterium]|nr:hypothetical protein [Myxococcales bacterium]
MIRWTFKLPTEAPVTLAAQAFEQVLGPLRCPAHGKPAAVSLAPIAGGVAVTITSCCDALDGLCRARLERPEG